MTIKAGDKFEPLSANNNLSASDTEDGDLTEKIEVLNSNVNSDVPGTYQVTYKVIDSDGNVGTKEITVLVLSNESPTINANDISIQAGENFDPLNAENGLIANDVEDGDLTSQISVSSNNVDPNTPGTYTVIYSVIDSDGNTSYKEIQVIVTTNESPVINANNVTIQVGDKFEPLNAGNGLIANDPEDGDLTSQISVVSSDVDTQTPGKYTVVYSVQDSDGNIGTKEIRVLVLSNEVPKIDTDDTIKLTEDFDSLSKEDNLILANTGKVIAIGLLVGITLSTVVIVGTAIYIKKYQK